MSILNRLSKRRDVDAGLISRISPISEDSYRSSMLFDYRRLMTGMFPFDVMSGGGIPCNAISILYGPPQSGKTTILTKIIAAAQKTCFRCMKPKVLCDCEEGELHGEILIAAAERTKIDPLYTQSLGVDLASKNCPVIEYEVTEGEVACHVIEDAIKYDEVGLIIVDSIQGLVPDVYMSGPYAKCVVGDVAKMQKRLAMRCANALREESRRGHNVALIFTNHVGASIGGQADELMPGANGLKHYSRFIARVGKMSVDAKDKDKETGLDNVLRSSIRLTNQNTKQQLLTLRSLCETHIAVRTTDEYECGTVFDTDVIMKELKDKDSDFLTKTSEGYMVGSFPFVFRVLSDIQETLRTGQYLHQETGEVLEDAGLMLKYGLVQHLRERYISKLIAGGTKVIAPSEVIHAEV